MAKLITFLEYENNHISSISLCKNVNVMIAIEYISHLILNLVLLIFVRQTWVALLLNLPLLLFHLKRFIEKSYELDPTELYKDIRQRKDESIVHIVYYVLLFGYYLYAFIRAVIEFEHTD